MLALVRSDPQDTIQWSNGPWCPCMSIWMESLPWEPTTFNFRGYSPYLGGLNPPFFMLFWGPKEACNWWYLNTFYIGVCWLSCQCVMNHYEIDANCHQFKNIQIWMTIWTFRVSATSILWCTVYLDSLTLNPFCCPLHAACMALRSNFRVVASRRSNSAWGALAEQQAKWTTASNSMTVGLVQMTLNYEYPLHPDS